MCLWSFSQMKNVNAKQRLLFLALINGQTHAGTDTHTPKTQVICCRNPIHHSATVTRLFKSFPSGNPTHLPRSI